jgi:putative acetyltransferase
MKIRRVTAESLAKAVALLGAAFPDSSYEAQLVQQLHDHGKPIHDWVCIHTNKVIAYIAFSNAYQGKEVCGLHLGPLAVNPEFQKQGIGSELLRFALNQEPIKTSAVFVLGNPGFYQRFGFSLCSTPLCPFDTNNAHFLSIRNPAANQFTVGYEAEFVRQPPAKHAAKRKEKGRRSHR